MFTAILAIVAAVVLITGFFEFIYPNLDAIFSYFDWARGVLNAFSSNVPSWLVPIVVIALVLAALSILVKLL